MRDPKRIPETLDKLKPIWSSFPDLRLGQMILNAVRDPMLYYIEDAELIQLLREHYFAESEVTKFEDN